MKYLRLIGIFLFIFILWQVDWGKALSIVIGMDYAAPIVAGLLNIAIMIVKAWRWHMLLRSQKISLSFSDALRIYVSAYYYGALTPGRLGEILKVFYLKRYCGTSAAVGLSSVLTDRLMDIYVSFILGCLGIYYFRLLGSMSLLGLVLPLLSLLFIGVLFHRKSALFLVDRFSRIFLLRRISARAEVFVREFTGAALAFITPALWLPVAITLATYAVFFYGCLIVAQALGIDISYLDIAIVVSIGSIVSMIPISKGRHRSAAPPVWDWGRRSRSPVLSARYPR